MGVETLTRNAIALYEERSIIASNGIDKLIFSTLDEDTSANFRMDKYISAPYGIVYRSQNNQSVIRHFQPGSTELITPPVASEKTPMDEQFSDVVAVGVESSAGYQAARIKNVSQIVGDHMEAHHMTKWKQAIDVLVLGVFKARGSGDAALGLDIDFTRAAGNSLTNDFTSVDMPAAIAAMVKKMRDNNAPMQDLVILMGSDWLDNYSTDTSILELRKANGVNELVKSSIAAQLLENTHGLFIVDYIRIPGVIAPVWITSFAPGVQYKADNETAAADWIASTVAVCFSLADKTYRVNRGVNTKGDNKIERRVGDEVFDSFAENDPATEFVRSQTRHAFVYGNINHTVKSTGTFS